MTRRGRRKLPGRGRCPGCGKLGLGVIRRSVVHGTVVAFRSCRYCGEQVDMERGPTGGGRRPDADPA